MKKGDRVIIATFTDVDEAQVGDWKPTVVLVDENNNIVDPAATEVPGPGAADARRLSPPSCACATLA